MPNTYVVYILASLSRRLYTGVTSDLLRRLVEHRTHVLPDSFTARYKITRLVYYEATEKPWSAIAREKEIKRWDRARRVALIESMNRDWRDLALDLIPRDAP